MSINFHERLTGEIRREPRDGFCSLKAPVPLHLTGCPPITHLVNANGGGFAALTITERQKMFADAEGSGRGSRKEWRGAD